MRGHRLMVGHRHCLGVGLRLRADDAEHAAAVIQRKRDRAHALPAPVPRDAGRHRAQGAFDGGRQMRRRTFGDQDPGLAPDAALPGAASGEVAGGGYGYMDVEPALTARGRPGVVRGGAPPGGGAAR
ncbi:hypothetical protein D3C72_1860390 [compost metagenome]